MKLEIVALELITTGRTGEMQWAIEKDAFTVWLAATGVSAELQRAIKQEAMTVHLISSKAVMNFTVREAGKCARAACTIGACAELQLFTVQDAHPGQFVVTGGSGEVTVRDVEIVALRLAATGGRGDLHYE